MGLDLGFDADEPAPQNAAACRCSTRGFRCTCCYAMDFAKRNLASVPCNR